MSYEHDVPAYRPGDRIAGHLMVEAPLAQGGAGAVYRVRDERKSRKLALKQLRAQGSEHGALLMTQFAREYHTLSQLAHPRIIEVYDYGVEQGSPYYTMELLDGSDLHDRGKLPYRTACALLCDVASSLSILHARGLIHRDVSARNVRCTSDGRAKLIDFGAMVAAGSVQRAVGTPPFVAPEVLQMQSLDARADLYGLGALAYWTLTGRHAYPAQTFQQLREAWRRPPPKVRELVKDVPEALSELVMSLLRLDREERPRTASEVMERLSGIAGLPREELPQVGRAYLITPRLVGRGAQLQLARAVLARTLNSGRGAALLIEGAPGMGRSRFLDACVLEAKLLGAVVLRGGASDAARGDYGVVRALLEQLLDACPDLCERAAEPRAALLAHVLPELAPLTLPAGNPERRHLQAALRDFLLSLTRTKHVVLAVDDVAAIDEPSSALLCALAHGTQRRQLSLLLTATQDEQIPSAIGVLRGLSQRIALEPFNAQQSEELLASLFGDSPSTPAFALRMHALCGGSPRELMRLAEHLVDRGLVRYEAGSWALPLELRDEDLPRSDPHAVERRIAALGADARELAQALALTDVRSLSLEHYALLTEHGDAGRTFAALDELVRNGIVVQDGERFRLSAADVLAPLATQLSAEHARLLHARLSRAFPPDRRSGIRLRHLLRGGQEETAIAELLSGPPDERYPGRLDALAEAAERAQRDGISMLTQLELHYRIARLAALMLRPQLFERYGWPLIERLRRESGLLDCTQVDATLDPPARMAEAVRLARLRYEQTPDAERGFEPHESLVRLVGMYGSGSALAASAGDLAQVERLGSLEPWTESSRAIRVVQIGIDTNLATLRGDYGAVERACGEILRELDRPQGLNPSTAKTIRLATVNTLAVVLAVRANRDCDTWIGELDAEPGYRGQAWRCRMLYRLAVGELERAREYEQRAELLDLQDSGIVTRAGATVGSEVTLQIFADDLPGLKRAGARVASLVRSFPRWQLVAATLHATCAQLQGDAAGALQIIEVANIGAEVGRHPWWAIAAQCHLEALLALGRTHEALELGDAYVRGATSASIRGSDTCIGALAQAMAAVGRVDDAERLAEQNLADMHARGTGGIRLGRAFEVRAYIAIAQRDAAAFKTCAEHCAASYLRGRSPGLLARYERLQSAAIAAGMLAPVGQPDAEAPDAALPDGDAARTVYSRMLTCVSPVERAERALQLVLEATGARIGYFFGLRAGKLELLFNPEPEPPASALGDMLNDCLERELGTLGGEAVGKPDSLTPRAIATPQKRFIDALGRTFEPLVLAGSSGGEAVIAGVAALHYGEDDPPAARKAMLDAVIEALISDDVVDPITCIT